MHDAIQISKLNDFIFSPKSIFYHGLYENFSELLYHDVPQTSGKLAHESIDSSTYSSAKRYLQGMPVYSEEYNVIGKIDIYDQETKTLIERKNLVKKIYEGYILQLYAQMFCMEEAGYEVKALKIHSLSDNKRYDIPLPTPYHRANFLLLIKRIRKFDISKYRGRINKNKLDNCIYKIFYA
jgi:CRISPR-associated exonuclease Cas4